MTAADRDTHDLQRALDLAGLDAALGWTLSRAAESFLASDWLAQQQATFYEQGFKNGEAQSAARDRRVAAQAWDEGYDAGQRDWERVSKCPGSSGCDCDVPTTNPYEDDRADTTEGTPP